MRGIGELGRTDRHCSGAYSVIMMLRERFIQSMKNHRGRGSLDDKSVVELSWKEGNQTAEKAATNMERGTRATLALREISYRITNRRSTFARGTFGGTVMLLRVNGTLKSGA
jgi:hypothetical protein